MTRQRLTWNQRPAQQRRQASPPPQMPAVDRTEGPDHPAYYPDPDKDKYESGDTSSWAEDPKKPMIPESAPPAMPGNLTTEPLEHPATSQFERGAEKPGRQASIRQLAERKAGLCIRIATAILGKTASELAIENRAFALMDCEDSQLLATAATLKLVASEEEEMDIEEVVEDDEDDDDDSVVSSKKANHKVVARFDRIEASLGKVIKALGAMLGKKGSDHFFGCDDDMMSEDMMSDDMMTDDMAIESLMAEDMDGDGIDQSMNDFPQDYDVDRMSGEEDMDEEEMLKAMLEDMEGETDVMASHAADSVDPLAKGPSIQSGEGGNVSPDAAPVTPQVSGPQTGGTAVKNAGDMPDFIQDKIDAKKEKEKKGEKEEDSDKEASLNPVDNDIEISSGVDPMGLMDMQASDNDDELMKLYAELSIPKAAGEDEDEEDEEAMDIELESDSDKEAAQQVQRTAAAQPKLRPQMPKAASGKRTPQRLGAVSPAPTGGVRSEIQELSKLWDTAPDVSGTFGGSNS